tara:strand:- start:143 stop:391 length:249 start_codon:yes stop_codon:yes gene_type:complete
MDKVKRILKNLNVITFLSIVAYIVTISIFLGCSTPIKTDYEQHKIDVKEYRNITDLRGIPHSQLHEMWETLYIEYMIQRELN